MNSPSLLVMVFLFGLIHGFGLSARLQELPLGEQDGDMLLKIISFNVGVEVGQILALIMMLIVLRVWRKSASFLRLSKVANDMLMLAGFMLLLMQLHGYLHSVNTEEFGFNKDAYYHIHEEMDAAKTDTNMMNYKGVQMKRYIKLLMIVCMMASVSLSASWA